LEGEGYASSWTKEGGKEGWREKPLSILIGSTFVVGGGAAAAAAFPNCATMRRCGHFPVEND